MDESQEKKKSRLPSFGARSRSRKGGAEERGLPDPGSFVVGEMVSGADGSSGINGDFGVGESSEANGDFRAGEMGDETRDETRNLVADGMGAPLGVSGVENRETAQEAVGPKKKFSKKILVGILAGVCVVGIGVGVYFWMNRDATEEGEAEVLFLGMNPGEENERKEAMLTALDEAVVDINEVASRNGGVTFATGEGDVYNFEIIEKNIDEYLEGIEDDAKRARAMAFAVSALSSIDDIEGAEKIIPRISTENFSEVEWFCYYEGMLDYAQAVKDEEGAKKYFELLRGLVNDTETQEDAE